MCCNLKLVTFDVTNTLLKFRRIPAHQYAAVSRSYGFKICEENLNQHFREQFKRMWKQYPNFGSGSNINWEIWWREVVRGTFSKYIKDQGAIDSMASRLIENFKTKDLWLITDGAIEILTHLKERNVILGVISNFDPRLHTILHNIELEQYFDFVVTSYESGYYKPNSRIFDTALAKCPNVDSKQAVHIGDNVELDYFGAKNAGWNALLVNDGLSKENLNTIPPIHIFNKLKDLTNYIISNKIIL